MKTKALATALLLTATNFAWAQGGLGINNVKLDTYANQWTDTTGSQPTIETQGPIDKFNVDLPARDKKVVDTNRLKHSYNGQAKVSTEITRQVAGRPNFIRHLRRFSD